MLNKNIFNIPSNYNFLESLFSWLNNDFQDIFNQDLSKAKIFLPSKRACRKFQEMFAGGFLTPNIKAISEINYQDFIDQNVNNLENETQNKILDGLEYLLFLKNEIEKFPLFKDLKNDQSLKVAINLLDLFEDIEIDDIGINLINEIDDSNLSKHRQVTLNFLKDFYCYAKNNLIKENIIFKSSYQNLLIQKIKKIPNKNISKRPIIIAGSTGSNLFSQNLIEIILKKENGFVILQNLDRSIESKVEESHHQFFLQELLLYLKTKPSEVTEIIKPKSQISIDERQKFLSTAMISNQQISRWQSVEKFIDLKKISTDFQENISLFEVENYVQESKVITQIIAENINKNKIALLTKNQFVIDLVKIELNNASIAFNDSRNIGILNSKIIRFLLLILDLIETDFNSHSLLAVMKHPFCLDCFDFEMITKFEMNILRQDRLEKGLKGLEKKLEEDEILSNFFKKFLSCFVQGNEISSLVKTAENLSKKTLDEMLRNDLGSDKIIEFFDILERKKYKISSSKEFEILANQVEFFENYQNQKDLSVDILSNMEARLLNFDLIIIASLNDGDFPEREVDNWLGKKIRIDLGIDRKLKKIGQNSYDFFNYMSNKSVVITRSKTNNNSKILESSFLLRLKTLCKKFEINFSLNKNINNSKLDLTTICHEIENPKPKIEYRPKRISITDINKLISDPYSFYVKKILQLQELNKIDFIPEYKEFGSFVHRALECFIKNPQEHNFIEIFEKFFCAQNSKIIWLPRFEKIFEDFLKLNQQFDKDENRVEFFTKLTVQDIEIIGKVDRVIKDKKNGFIKIIDYKTGGLPSKKSIIEGLENQLSIMGLSLSCDFKIESLCYWKLSHLQDAEIKQMISDKEIDQILFATKNGLEMLIKHFSNENNGYISTNKTMEGEYKNLLLPR